MVTNCLLKIENPEFDFIIEGGLDTTIHCTNPLYEGGAGCQNCYVYRQLFETPSNRNNEDDLEEQTFKS